MSPRRPIDESWSSGRVPELEKELAAVRAERESARLAERRWRSLMDLSPFGIVIYGPDGSVVAGNAAMSRIFSLTDAESDAALANYNILEDPQLAARGLKEHVQRAFSGHPVVFPPIEYEIETPIERKKVKKWMEGIFYPIMDSDGALREVISIQADVTPLVTAREELRVSRDTLREGLGELERLYATTPVGLGLMDTELRFVRLNETLATINGPSRREHLGKTLSEIAPAIAEKLEPICRKVIATGEPELALEIHGTTPAQPGVERDWLVSYFPVKGDDASVRGVSMVVQEITDLKRAEAALRQSEARFREMAENIREVFWLFDVAEEKVIYVSPAFETVWGRPADDILADYSVWGDSIHPDDREFAFESFALIQETGGGEAREYRIVRPNGEVRWVSDRGFAIRDDEERVVRVAGLAEDITARKEAEEERLSFEAKIQHAQKLESLGVLAGGIAHDFNNLLMGVLGNADLALTNLPPQSAARDLVAKIRSAAQRASELTNQMLAYSGKGRFVIEAVDLNRLVEEMAHLLEAVISKKAALRLDLAHDLPAIEGDASQIRQVVMNLITNASEAIGDGPGAIHVRTFLADVDAAALADCLLADRLAPGRYVALEVADTGHGMDEETQRRVFDPFFTTKFTGRGLGLAAVLGIVRGHGAAIRVESEEGKGSRFAVLFPPSAAAPVEPRSELEQAAAIAEATILVVDDERMVREVARKMLTQAGFKVMVAEDGQAGVELFRQHPDEINLVLLDLTMPRIDGAEALRLMREVRSDVRVLLSSGYGEQNAAERLAGEPTVAFIQKPYTTAALVRKIREALNG